jgi:hypothetical protein
MSLYHVQHHLPYVNVEKCELIKETVK